MRIAVAYDCYFPLTTGGGERQYGLFAQAYAAAGHQVDYLTRRQWDGPAPQGAPGVTVRPVTGAFEIADGEGNRRPLAALRFAAGLFRYLVRHRHTYDAVVVSALPLLNVFAARLALLGAGVPQCYDFLEVWRSEQWLEYSGPVVGRVARVVQRVAVRVSPHASCHSRMNGARLIAEGVRRQPIVSPGLIAQDAIDVPPPATFRPGPVPTLLYVGRHIADKQVETIPAALVWARERVPGLGGVILGTGQRRDQVEAEVARLGLTDVVELPGFVPEDELRHYLEGAAVLVNPSRREGYGLVVVEACASGTPVVLVDAVDNASVELVEDGVNGYVAASTDPAVLGAAIVRAVEGGEALRASSRQWFEGAARTRTARSAAFGILSHLTGGGQ